MALTEYGKRRGYESQTNLLSLGVSGDLMSQAMRRLCRVSEGLEEKQEHSNHLAGKTKELDRDLFRRMSAQRSAKTTQVI